MDITTGTIIGITVGVLFALNVTIIFIVFVVRKRNQRDSRRRQPLEIANTGKTTDSKRLFLIKSLSASPEVLQMFKYFHFIRIS